MFDDLAEELDQQQLTELYIRAVRDAWLTRISAFVVASLVVYDYLISFHLEYELIWKKRWSIIKAVFLWHRYFGFLCVIFQCIALISSKVTDRFCSVWFRWETWGTPVLLFSSEVVVILWIWVIYAKSKPILGVMVTLFAAEVGGVLFILVKSLSQFSASAHTIPGVTYCLITRATPQLRLLWIPILGFDTILLGLFLYKGFQSYSPSKARDRFGVLSLVYKHSLLNFLAIFASYLACAVIWTVAEPGLSQIPVGFALSLSITNCTRLLLNIRRAYYIGPRGATSVMVYPDSGDEPHSSTTPIIPWDACDASHSEAIVEVDMAETLLEVEDAVDPRRSVEKVDCDDAMDIASQDRARWQYELRTMKAEA